jgi:hypothetical protein
MIVEFILIINTHKKHRGLSVDALCAHIRQTERVALLHYDEQHLTL